MNLWNEISSSESEVPSQRKAKRPVPLDGSHAVALTQPRQKKGKALKLSDISTSVHITVQIRNKSLTRRHLRLMFEVLLYEIIMDGADFEKYLMLVHLMNLTFGQKIEPLDLNNEHERRLCLLSMIIMKALSGQEFDYVMSPKDNKQLPIEIKESILQNDLIMNRRTYMSRCDYWNPELWLTIRTVDVDEIIERSGNTERYSSYCKGYGESHPSAHFKKTGPSAELDGETSEIPREITLKELKKLLCLTQLNLKPRRIKSKD